MSFLGIGSRIYDEFTKEAVLGGLLSKAVGGASKMLGGASKVLGGMAGAAPAAIPRAPVRRAAAVAMPRAVAPAASVAMPRPAAPSGMAAVSPPQSPAALPFPKKKPSFNILSGGPELQSPISHPKFQFAYDRIPVDEATFNQFLTAPQIQGRADLKAFTSGNATPEIMNRLTRRLPQVH